MARPTKKSSDRKGTILFARVDSGMGDAFRRFCAEVHGEGPSVVMRSLVRDALRAAGYLAHPTHREPKGAK